MISFRKQLAYKDIAKAPLNSVKHGVTQIERARIIKRTLGVPVAAKYLRIRGWSVEAAVHILATI